MKASYHQPDLHRRTLAPLWLSLVAGAALLAACTGTDVLTGDDTDATPVTLTADIRPTALPRQQTATPGTRTLVTDDGSTRWAAGDAVGIFMLASGGAIPADVLPGADNKRFTVDPANGTLTPADDIPLYYPNTDDAVDFVACYPYAEYVNPDKPEFTAGKLTDQTTPERQAAFDVLHSRNATGIQSRRTAVSLHFRHLMSKLVFDITLGEGFAADADVTAVTLDGMPPQVRFDMSDGSVAEALSPTPDESISTLRLTTPSTGANATYTALVAPQEAGDYPGRTITVTVAGTPYTAAIPAADAYVANNMHVYPVTVKKTDINLDSPVITRWENTAHAPGHALYSYTVTYLPNGGTGSIPAVEVTEGTPVTISNAESIIPPGDKVLIGWSTTPDASTDFYHPGTSHTLMENLTLYAIWSGDGSSDKTPLLIYDAQGMANIAKAPNKCYRLAKDLTLNNWAPLGNKGDSTKVSSIPFTGTFDGAGHTVTIKSLRGNWFAPAGLFSEAGPCLIRRVCVTGEINHYLHSFCAAGGIVGQAADGCVIEDCLVTADITAGSANNLSIGGILGRGTDLGSGTIVRNCLARGKLMSTNGTSFIGGIAGDGEKSVVVNCVVLSEEIIGSSMPGSPFPKRIGLATTLSNNYAPLIPTQPGHKWNPKPNGEDGENCDPTPAHDWWTALGRWKTNDGYTAWDFTSTWKIGTDGYPCLRVIQ